MTRSLPVRIKLAAAMLLVAFLAVAIAQQTPEFERMESSELGLLVHWRDIKSALAKLSPSAQSRLARQRERFEALPPSEQDRFRKLHTQLTSSSDAQRLYGTLQEYGEWLNTLSAADRARILDMPARERILAIRKSRASETQKWLDSLREKALQPEDSRVILDFVRDFVQRNKKEFIELVPPDRRNAVRRVEPAGMQSLMLWMGAIQSRDKLPSLSDRDVRKLSESLSATAKRNWEETAADERLELLVEWSRIAGRRMRLSTVTEKELEDFYVSQLSPVQRDKLNQLPPREMKRRLRQLYIRENFGGPPGPPGPPGIGSERGKRGHRRLGGDRSDPKSPRRNRPRGEDDSREE